MERKDFLTWYLDKGCCLLNKTLLALAGKKVGQIPFNNLVPEEFSELGDIDHVIDVLVNDGFAIDEVKYTDGSRELFIYVK